MIGVGCLELIQGLQLFVRVERLYRAYELSDLCTYNYCSTFRLGVGLGVYVGFMGVQTSGFRVYRHLALGLRRSFAVRSFDEGGAFLP